jgi:hypothetical protein
VAEMYLVHLQKVSNGESNKNPGFTRQEPPPPPRKGKRVSSYFSNLAQRACSVSVDRTVYSNTVTRKNRELNGLYVDLVNSHRLDLHHENIRLAWDKTFTKPH